MKETAAPVLVTGTAGFIGFHVALKLMSMGHKVVGYDNINDYYDVNLKYARLEELNKNKNFAFVKGDLSNAKLINETFQEYNFKRVVNLAAQAGVRYSLKNPQACIDSNITGFINILEACRHNKIEHLVYASSSSVYGSNRKLPFSVDDSVDHPISLYAATKKSNELMAHSYSHLFGLPTTGLRFFTVYGPWGRPDMALFIFARAIMEGKPIEIFNEGKMRRDFTYIDDIVQGVVKVLHKVPEAASSGVNLEVSPATSHAPYRVYNIGNNQSVELLHAVRLLEIELGRSTEHKLLPMQLGDVEATYADIDALRVAVGYQPTTSIEQGIRQFIAWFKQYHKIS